ncbi:hypothetical protein JCM10450v2_007830 [Rhodotorula kratochvilovae]
MSSSHSGRSPHHATGSSSFDVSSLSNALPSTSERRMRQQTFAKPPSPSSGYLAVASEAPSTLDPSAGVAAEPLVVVLSLNNTLLFRPKRSTKGSTMPIVRPYLSTFLEYLCGSHLHPSPADREPPARAFEPIVYSAARAHNVLTLLRAVGLVPPLAAAGDDGAYRPREGEGDVLRAVLSRESMGMMDADYRRDVQAVKDLGKVWSELGLEEKDGTRRTVLLEEEEPAAAAQPYSRLPITPFLVSNPSSTLSRPSVRELPCSSADDPALLITIHLLELLRSEKNAPAALKAGLVRRGEDAAREAVRAREGRGEREEVGGREVSEEMARKGREVCERHGVEVRREWSGAWRERVVQARKEREGRGQESTGKA